MTSRSEAEAVMDAFAAAFAGGDVAAIQSLYAPDAVIWHNNDGVEQTREHSLFMLGWLAEHTASRSYQEVRRFFDDGRLIEQHTVVMETAAGVTIRCPACLVVEVHDGLIARIDEYIDAAPFAALTGS